MLKALELSGFKSFADRTRFDFPRGISIVVGPNGSGKSNIVDAIKWVLGSQSAKALRGKEMTDVIFNGCATRSPLGTAEATLTLDNSNGKLSINADEVHVTRRVYRSGEGEYLINRQPCRLRDIREVLAGTGVTTESYFIIEQGKVDALLQSSPRDRRVIFEEAAGISQFKAKKVASLRRLERVEQNLLRLSDIVDEIESRLRSVRMQAGKARRYRECAARLQELRTQLGLVDWRAQTEQIAAREAQLTALRRRQEDVAAGLAECEATAQNVDRQLEAASAQLREIDAAAGAAREQIAARQTAIEHQRLRDLDLQREINRARNHLAALVASAGNAGDETRDAARRLEDAESELAAAKEHLGAQLDRQRKIQSELNANRSEVERLQSQQLIATQSAAQLEHRKSALQSQLASVNEAQERLRRQLAGLAQRREPLDTEVQALRRAEGELAAQVQSNEASLAAAESRLSQIRSELHRADKQHRQLEGRLTRTRERIAVLTELELRLEGLDGGVQDVLRMAREQPTGPLGEVCGVVADLFHVDVDTAPLIEVALGERAQFLVLTSAARLLESLEREPLKVGGRIGFLRLDARAPATVLDNVDLSAEPGVMGRADRFIESAAQFTPLARRLLGRTWLVDRLATAQRLAQSAGRGLEFVTSDGELLAADGTLVVGPRRAVTGMLSRRSELRACRQQTTELEEQLAQHEAQQLRLDQDRLRQEAAVTSSTSGLRELAARLTALREQMATVAGNLQRFVDDEERLGGELHQTANQISEFTTELAQAVADQANVENTAAQLQLQVDTAKRKASSCDSRLGEQQAQTIQLQIAAAKCEERVAMRRQQAEQAERTQQERAAALAEMRHRLDLCRSEAGEVEGAILRGRQELADLLLLKERYIEQAAKHAADNESIRRQRASLNDRISAQRQQLTSVQSQQHKLEVVVTRLRHERQTLCERMQDDYGIDLAEAASSERSPPDESDSQGDSAANSAHQPPDSVTAAPLDRATAEREIAELREQMNNIGSVNLAALEELETLETRFGSLSQQYRDLVDAKGSLERIISRINIDSRQLFLATLETIRGHFQELFRRLFGGGEADIIVDEAEDVLECGIEIVARPPGKEACIISLLSGGEKTLTCVALLLAVFRSKPSPFCILDEVDAALDEANIGRFVGVLREFLSFTQFVVVTHSKKTMAGADTLYGVTMEESGVSKRVSVRFEDVSEDGEILPSALVASADRRTESADRRDAKRAA